ncbi:MAG: hypothetical protein AAB880_01200 [Patescibacteria group bacterium]
MELPLKEEIKEILDRKIDLPRDRHELCLENKNRFHLLHADSDIKGGLIFYTNDLAQSNYGKENNLGAMAIKLFYNNNLLADDNYEKVGDLKKCIKLETAKLQNYASSTIEYGTISVNRLEELDLGEQGKFTIGRRVVGGHYIDTADSSAYISARLKFFLITLVTLFGFFSLFVNWISKHRYNFFKKRD